MRKIATFLLSAATLTCFLFAAPTMAQQAQQPQQAQQAQQTQASGTDWRVECGNDGKALDCRAFMEVFQRDNRQLVIVFAVRYPTDTKKPVLMIQVPLGILVTEPITIAVDTNQPERAVIQTCTQAGCFAGSPASDALIASMRTGKQLKVTFANINKQPVAVTLPLAGFALAYDKIKN